MGQIVCLCFFVSSRVVADFFSNLFFQLSSNGVLACSFIGDRITVDLSAAKELGKFAVFFVVLHGILNVNP